MDPVTITLMITTIVGGISSLLLAFRKNITSCSIFGRKCIDFKENTPPPSVSPGLDIVDGQHTANWDTVNPKQYNSVHISQL